MNKEQKKMWKKLSTPYEPTDWMDEYEARFQQEYKALFAPAKNVVSAFENLGKAFENLGKAFKKL